jgi:hypothetical protein
MAPSRSRTAHQNAVMAPRSRPKAPSHRRCDATRCTSVVIARMYSAFSGIFAPSIFSTPRQSA